MEKKKLIRNGLVFAVILLLIGAVQIVPAAESETGENEQIMTIKLNVLDGNNQEIIMKFDSFKSKIIDTTSGEYALIELADESYSSVVGEARLPTIRRIIEMPHGAQPEISINEVSWKQTSLKKLNLPNKIVPVQRPIPKTVIPEQWTEFDYDNDFYSQDEYIPVDVVRVVETGEIRGRCFAMIEISPVQYNPLSGELKLLNSLDVSIELPGSDMERTAQNRERYSSPVYEDLFKATFLNYNQNDNEGSGKDGEVYIIVVHDNFYNQILPFASWKQSLGFDVTTIRTSEVPGSGSLLQKIEDYIEDAYYNWPTPPTYVLLVGDTGYVPTYTSGLEYGVSCTDLFYVTITLGDYYPDVFIGRFPAASPSHVTTMVDKTLTYEQRGYPSPDFLTYACFMAGNDNYQISEGTHNYCIANYLQPNGWSYDRIYEVTYGGTTQDVRNAFNDGRILGVFSGHGGSDCWADGPYFSQSDVNGLTNLGEYPFVFSHACSTGTFTVSECFGETWLRAADKAGIFFWGAAASTWWTEDDWLQKNWFSAWWDDGIETISGLTVQGMIDTVNQMGSPSDRRYYFQAYNILGDPSLIIATEGGPEDDVGVIEINSPLEITYPGSNIVGATIENFGLNDQVGVPVTCEIYSFDELPYTEDFETDDGGYTHGGPTDLWEWGTPIEGPDSAHSGDFCWGTDLDDRYPDYADAIMDSVPINLPEGLPSTLSFWHWYHTEPEWDGGNVKISTDGGDTWEVLGSYLDPYNVEAAEPENSGIPGEPCFSGHGQRIWELVSFDLSAYAGEEIMLRWHFGSDLSVRYEGWYIDDVTVDVSFSKDLVYSGTITVDVASGGTAYVEFSPPWDAQPGTYGIIVTTELPGDEDSSNDQRSTVVTVSILGDLDLDGDVDLNDLGQLLANYGMQSGATYEMGDIDGDGDVDLSDLAALLGNYGAGT